MVVGRAMGRSMVMTRGRSLCRATGRSCGRATGRSFCRAMGRSMRTMSRKGCYCRNQLCPVRTMQRA